ncbi:MAG: hypothetical protein KDA73_16075 [Rhodobacteraceae bacterium]|nr:hypothetical protein [Paracoccaceae bacterium]
MTDAHITVPAGETGILRLFTLAMADPAATDLRESLAEQRDDAGALLARALGATDIDPYWVALIDIRDLGELGLEGYLAEGHDVPAEALKETRPALEAATGTVLAVPSRAFGAEAQELDPAPWLIPLATYDTKRDPAPVEPLPKAEVLPRPPRPTAPSPLPDPAPQRRSLGPLVLLAIVIVAGIAIALVGFRG